MSAEHAMDTANHSFEGFLDALVETIVEANPQEWTLATTLGHALEDINLTMRLVKDRVARRVLLIRKALYLWGLIDTLRKMGVARTTAYMVAEHYA